MGASLRGDRRSAPAPGPDQETGSPTSGVVLAHDYATQRGGAERVALKIAEAFPDSPMFTTLYDPEGTFPEFRRLDVRPGPLNRYAPLRRHHRLALPLLASSVNAQRISGALLIASSTGWAHGYQGTDHTVVYCHAPARWLYQSQQYLGTNRNSGLRGRVRHSSSTAALHRLDTRLREWDQHSARRADLFLVNSTATQRAVERVYGIEAEVLSPPPALTAGGPEQSVEGVEPGYLLCVARLMPYKNVDAVIGAVNSLPEVRLVVVGTGPEEERLRALAGPRVQLMGAVSDVELRWLYRHASALVAASYEDYGLSPLEAGSFGKPSVVLHQGGFVDTVLEGVTGVFVDVPTPAAVAAGIREVQNRSWDEKAVTAHVARFSSERFIARLHEVAERFGAGPVPPRGLAPPTEQAATAHGGADTRRSSGERVA